MLRGRCLATPSAVLSKDAFRKEAALRVEGQPSQVFSTSFVLSVPSEMLYPHGGVAALLTVRGELPKRPCLDGSMLLCEARPGPPPVNRRRAVSPSPTYS